MIGFEPIKYSTLVLSRFKPAYILVALIATPDFALKLHDYIKWCALVPRWTLSAICGYAL